MTRWCGDCFVVPSALLAMTGERGSYGTPHNGKKRGALLAMAKREGHSLHNIKGAPLPVAKKEVLLGNYRQKSYRFSSNIMASKGATFIFPVNISPSSLWVPK